MMIDVLRQEIDLLKQELIAAYDAKGMRASGRWADSLESSAVEKTAGGFVALIKGLEYSKQLESGRSPGKQPPSKAIEQWIIDKGIASRVEGEISVSSLAYLIARKIAREGWKRQQYGGVNLISDVVTPDRIQQILDKVSDAYVITVTNEINNEVKALAV